MVVSGATDRAIGCVAQPELPPGRGWRGRTTQKSRLKELQSFVDKLCVVLEDGAVSGIGVELEFGVR